MDLDDGKPPHYWIVLSSPRLVTEQFLAVSFTDRHNFESNTDIWQTDTALCPELSLSKPSVVFVRRAKVITQSWLNQYNAELIGRCDQGTLERARCNFHWFKSFVDVPVLKFCHFYGMDWISPCGGGPQPTVPLPVPPASASDASKIR
jgi:hypothetical protein